jgi:hypothetical protein
MGKGLPFDGRRAMIMPSTQVQTKLRLLSAVTRDGCTQRRKQRERDDLKTILWRERSIFPARLRREDSKV